MAGASVVVHNLGRVALRAYRGGPLAVFASQRQAEEHMPGRVNWHVESYAAWRPEVTP